LTLNNYEDNDDNDNNLNASSDEDGNCIIDTETSSDDDGA